MLVPNESIAELAGLTSLPGEWVREWAAGRGRRELARPARATERVSLIEIYLQKINLDALPGRAVSGI